MDEHGWMAERVKENEAHLRAVAYRMLGSLSEAEDAVQEAWIRLERADTHEVANLRAWLTTVVSRVCLDMLRARRSRREELLGAESAEPANDRGASDPETELVMADSVGVALLVVLETLPPAERIAFVLHDLFDLSFDEIAPIVERTPTAARQLASRARRRVQGTDAAPRADVMRQRQVVDAFIAASRDGDFDALLALLDPDVVLRADRFAMPGGVAGEVRGAAAVAKRARSGRDPRGRVMLVNGGIGIVVAPRGRLLRALRFTIENDRVVGMEVFGDPATLATLELSVLD